MGERARVRVRAGAEVGVGITLKVMVTVRRGSKLGWTVRTLCQRGQHSTSLKRTSHSTSGAASTARMHFAHSTPRLVCYAITVGTSFGLLFGAK